MRTCRITYPTNASHPLTVDYRYDRAGILRRLVSKQTGAANTILNFTYRNVAVDPIGRIIRDSLTCSPTDSRSVRGHDPDPGGELIQPDGSPAETGIRAEGAGRSIR